MRRILYIIILVALLASPVKRLDVADLAPVQTVGIHVKQNAVVLQTDTDCSGVGQTVEAALCDLEENTPGVIYLDTAEYLLIGEGAEVYVEALKNYLSPSVKMAQWDEKASIQSAAQYLDVRKDLPKLKSWNKKLQKN